MPGTDLPKFVQDDGVLEFPFNTEFFSPESSGFPSSFALTGDSFTSVIAIPKDLESFWKGHAAERCSTKAESRSKYFPENSFIKVSSQEQYLRIAERIAIYGCKSCTRVIIEDASIFQVRRGLLDITFLEHSFLVRHYHVARDADPDVETERWIPIDPLIIKRLKSYDWADIHEIEQIADRIRGIYFNSTFSVSSHLFSSDYLSLSYAFNFSSSIAVVF
jgi:hypothetical protein